MENTIYQVVKEFGKYKIGMMIDLDRLAETNYSEFEYLHRKIGEEALTPIIKEKSISEAPHNKAIENFDNKADNKKESEKKGDDKKEPVIKVKGE